MLAVRGYRFPKSQEQLRTTKDPRYVIFALIQLLAEDGIPIDVLDVGAFAGLVGIRCANLARCFGYDVSVKMFDPSIAGQLIPYNIEINRLHAPQVEHIGQAISLTGGPILFTTTAGHLDSAQVARIADEVVVTKYSITKTVLRMARRLPQLLLNPRALRQAVARRLRSAPVAVTQSYIVRSMTFGDYFALNPGKRKAR